MKIIRIAFALLFVSLVSLPVLSQAAQEGSQASPLYVPVDVVQRLSYDNFKNIKMLMTAIINYGGGQAEFDRLVDGYAEASSYYFSRDFKKAADAFTANERDIRAVAMKLAEKYKQDSEVLNREIITHNVKYRILQSVQGNAVSDKMMTAEKLISQSSESLAKGNDLLVRTRPMQAVQLYRRSKENSIQYWAAILTDDEYKKMKIDEKFEKEKVDNKNKVFVAKEKKN